MKTLKLLRYVVLAAVAVTTGGLSAAESNSVPEAAAAPVKSGTVENSVVKIFSTARYPDPYKPWTKRSPEEASGTGVVIEGKRILSNAHVVLYSSQIQIQANQAGDKISATVEAVAPGIDLAVLKLDDESFFDTHPPLARATALPDIKDVVMAYGYPEGGNSLSITKGIVSRVEFVPYNFPVSGLRIQVDAAINPGNSGGPAVVGDKMVGLTFSRLNDADNIGYIIPTEEIELFLKDIADGHYDGKPMFFDDLQTLENPALRAFLKLPAAVEGMVVHHPWSTNADYPLKQWDVITKIGDTPVDDQGMIKLGANLRVRFAYEVQHLVKDGKVPVTVMRAGKELPVQLPVAADYPALIPELNGEYPSYFIYGPLVFSSATQEFLGGYLSSKYANSIFARMSRMGNPLVTRLGEKQTFPGEQLVLISSPFFPHKLSQGYSNPFSQVVKSINGIEIKSLTQLVQVLRDCKDEFIEVECDSNYGETMIFPRKEMLSATDDILNDNGVRTQGSPDTMAVWTAKP